MFKDARVLTAQRTARKFLSALSDYSSAAESWFDGSVDSIDRRLAACRQLHHHASRAVSELPMGQARPYLERLSSLGSDFESLQELRYTVLTGAADIEDNDPISSPATYRDDEQTATEEALASEGRDRQAGINRTDRRWIELESARFVADNANTLHDRAEMAARAREYAAMKTSSFDPRRSTGMVKTFVASVEALRSAWYRPAPVQRTATATDFDAQLMFLS